MTDRDRPAEAHFHIDRRGFVRAGLAGGAAALAAGAWPTAAAGALAEPPRGAAGGAGVEELTVAELQAGMRAGRFTAHGLAQEYLARIATIDASGAALNAVIERNPDALAIAARLDAERRAGRVRGPLHGVPVLIKDNVDTADRMRTSAGSLALAESIAPRDAFIVGRLRDAGAVILGKTNLSEWANFRSTRSTSGWSGRGGQTRHPYALDRNPSGSSSGSAVAAAASLAAVTVGTETDGSIISPAAVCGVVGIKPTVGLVSRSGIIPISRSQDTAGPMARTVADAAALLGALAGLDAGDAATVAGRGHAAADYTRFVDAAGLRGARIGVARNYFGFNDRVDRVMEDALAAMREAGAVIVDPANIATAGRFDESELEVLLYEFKAGLNAYLASLGARAPHRSLAALIAFNDRNRDREMPYFGQELFLRAEAKGPLTDPAYRAALANNHRLARAEGIDATLAAHRLDAIVAPSNNPAWPTDLANGDHFTGGSSSAAAVAGYPSITVPAGFVLGLPVGISFVGPAWSEGRLIRLASAFERATSARRPPGYARTAGGAR